MSEKINDKEAQDGLKISEKNTWKSRWLDVTPDIQQGPGVVELLIPGKKVQINSFDEITLTLLLNFEFIPLWLLEQWYDTDDNGIVGIFGLDGREKVKEWIEVGLVYVENDPRGLFVRPTNVLFKLFNEEARRYKPLPDNLLTHTVYEIGISHDLMIGDSPILEKIKYLPRESKLGFGEYGFGTNILFEREFRYPGLFNGTGIKSFERIESEINQGIANKDQVTKEFEDTRYFSVIKKKYDTGVPKKDYVIHIPDMIVPMIRDENGMPQSTALEVELSVKSIKDYKETIWRYKNNNKFGNVIWLTVGARTAKSIKYAFQEAGGAGNTRFILMDYPVPEPKYTF